MASIHRQKGKPNWFCAFTVYDHSGNAKRVFRSTETSNKKQARQVCDTWQRAALKARNGNLTADSAREVIARGVADVLLALGAELPRHNVRKWCETWLEAKSIEAEPSTHARYTRIVERFLDFLRAKANRDLTTLEAADISRFRDQEAKLLSRATANLSLKVLRVCFGEALKQGVLAVNPAVRVSVLKSKDKSARRAFTLSEIKRILRACADDAEWRGLILFGLYLGQRLGDLARVTWRSVNLEAGEIAFTARKTGRRVVLPLPQPLLEYLASLPATDDPDAFIFPQAARATRTGTLSNQFREILVSAGLAEPRTHAATGKGRSQSRETSDLSFHSLRHSAVTMLKAAGVSDVLAREIIGHESAVVSRQYTHLTTDDMRNAMQRLPDVTNG